MVKALRQSFIVVAGIDAFTVRLAQQRSGR
jgi:hypothetical protein